ncbi:STAS domain-containing protein [Nonomuraea turcica]|uniref:STAS domain-containing protein n=1 Tax=Nonomuraea sp. G32 TaxID=3067274 RepID=UPI00273C312B|nr:STAS domain-containing protein [Nonomuraea sp. G32]MDP4511660.1 STAS domain-containing protein [Nonomuraea sp. G32]
MNTADTVGALTPGTVADRLLRITPLVDRAGLRIEGELDRATLLALTGALASMAGGGSFCVDLSGLVFCDVGGLRALVTAAAGLRGGHVLTLRSPSPQVRRLLELTGWHQTAGLHLQDRSNS